MKGLMMNDQCKDHSMIETTLNEMHSDVKDIKNMMNGNGKLGFCAKVNVMWGCSIFVVLLVVKEVWALIVN